jgi:hypothetical protein
VFSLAVSFDSSKDTDFDRVIFDDRLGSAFKVVALFSIIRPDAILSLRVEIKNSSREATVSVLDGWSAIRK